MEISLHNRGDTGMFWNRPLSEPCSHQLQADVIWLWRAVFVGCGGIIYDGQLLATCLCNLVKTEAKFRLNCKLCFPCAQYRLQQMHWTDLSVSNEANIEFVAQVVTINQSWRQARHFVLLTKNRSNHPWSSCQLLALEDGCCREQDCKERQENKRRIDCRSWNVLIRAQTGNDDKRETHGQDNVFPLNFSQKADTFLEAATWCPASLILVSLEWSLAIHG